MSAESWLVEKVGDAPQPLVDLMVEATRQANASSIPDCLAEGAILLYGRVVGGSGGREDAFPLLAADALFTHAFQAMAEVDPEGIGAFADRWAGSEALGRLAR